MKVFEFRLTPANQDQASWDETKMIKVLKDWCSKWAFQIECGTKTRKFHYQCRLSAKTKTTKAAMFKRLSAIMMEGDSWYLEPTSEQNQGNMFYVIKNGTRVRGPWTDKDSGRFVQLRFKDPVLRPWQARLLARIKKHQAERNDRNIIMVCERTGNIGKSFFKGYAEQVLGAKIIPATMQDGNDMIRSLACQVHEGSHDVHIVVMDVPRATHTKHWFSLARGLEIIKQGSLHDERHSFKKVIIEPPVVVCFMNDTPPEGCMSSDVFEYFDIE